MNSYFPATSFGTNSQSTASNYNWFDSASGLFSDALSAWVQIEAIQAQAGSNAASQEATRNATTYPSGFAPGGGGFVGGGGGGIGAGHLVIGGALIVGLVLLLK